ncbi:MAG: SnoaL-like domain [Pseudonocardiales bacterium]|nr:SnoaL-like domain [Pseudonocardiales bacterium]
MSLEPSERMEIEQLISDSCARGDHGESADWVLTLCTEGFALHGPGVDLDREQFEQWITLRAGAPFETRHQWTNLRVLNVDGDAVDIEWLECVHRRDQGSDVTIRTVGDIADRWVRTPAGWRLASRTITPVFDPPPAYWGGAEVGAAHPTG